MVKIKAGKLNAQNKSYSKQLNEKPTAAAKKNTVSGVEIRKIPESKFKRALELANNTEHEDWKDRKKVCARDMHLRDSFMEPSKIGITAEVYKVQLLRRCLLRRDWNNMARILSICNPSNSTYFNALKPLYCQYGTLLLAHNDKNLLDSYIKSMDKTVDVEELIKDCMALPSARTTTTKKVKIKTFGKIKEK